MPISDDLPVGAFLCNILGATNELGRALISDRTKADLAVARSRGTRLGRPSRQSQAAKERAMVMHASGMSLRSSTR